ncbi:MAG: DUF4062 domain-containing protein [Desulfobulbus sp.]|nr:DUF4062 domain-containing protein [Desulfobulbus sp.]
MSLGVYVCATYSDLEQHREALKSVIPTLSSPEDYVEFNYIGLEYRTADERPALESYFQALDEASYVVLLVGWRYGTIPEGNDKSILELEYEHAIEQHKSILCYFLEDNYPIPPNLIEHGEGAERLKRFKDRLKKEKIVSTFGSPDDLARRFAVDLTRITKTTMGEVAEHIFVRPLLESQLKQCEESNQRYLRTIDSLRARLDNIVPAEPIWATRNFKVDASLCFVLMPFADEFYAIYEQAISIAAQNVGLRCMHAGEIFDNREIVEDIWESICTAQIIVADVTHRNPNVFYELGICHTLGKEVIIVTQNRDDVPFDIRHRRYIEYSPNALNTLKNHLEKTIKKVVLRISENDTNELA